MKGRELSILAVPTRKRGRDSEGRDTDDRDRDSDRASDRRKRLESHTVKHRFGNPKAVGGIWLRRSGCFAVSYKLPRAGPAAAAANG